MRFLGFGRGSIYLDPEDGHWYNERNGKAKCNVAKVVLPHHDINCEDYQERLRTSCNIQLGNRHKLDHRPPERQVMEYLLFRWKARMNQFERPGWERRRVIALTYKEWPLAMSLNPRRLCHSMQGVLDTVVVLAEDPDSKAEFDFGMKAKEDFDIIMGLLLQETEYWDPPVLGKFLKSIPVRNILRIILLISSKKM